LIEEQWGRLERPMEEKLKGKSDVLETSKSDYTIERGRTQTDTLVFLL
jgi:hypothetical protein